MSKQHINDMKKALQGYYAQAQQAAAAIKKNNDRYRPDIAKQENDRITEQLKAARIEAETAIKAAQEAGRADAASWGKLSGNELTEDSKLLQMDISPAQFSDLVNRYKTNGTMSMMLSQYAEQKNKDAAKTGKIMRYDTSDIPTPEKKAGVYDRFAMNARNLIARTGQNDALFSGTDSVFLRESIEHFGERSEFNANLFDLL